MLVVYKTEAPEPELKQLAINSDRCMYIRVHILYMYMYKTCYPTKHKDGLRLHKMVLNHLNPSKRSLKMV